MASVESRKSFEDNPHPIIDSRNAFEIERLILTYFKARQSGVKFENLLLVERASQKALQTVLVLFGHV